MNKFLIITFGIIVFLPVEIFGEPTIKISISDAMNKLTLDGKWTHKAEWKHSSHNEMKYEDLNKIHFRSAHQENFIYFLIDFVSDERINLQNDSAILCLESGNNKTTTITSNVYCFETILGNTTNRIMQGDLSSNSQFKELDDIPYLYIYGDVSSDGDRYNETPHTSYEFKIPTDLVGRYSEYGLFFSVYEHESKKYYTWPHGIQFNNDKLISEPNQWGSIISPDKSLPEFNFSIMFLLLIPTIIVLQIYLNTTKMKLFKF